MSPSQPYQIIYAPITSEHIRAIDRKFYALIRDMILERLSYEPSEENRNRKPLKRPAFVEATWELRFGSDNMFRVFYDVKIPEREVHILAIGIKRRTTLYVGGEEIDL
jgi:mRNA-degrading endonuclease RelE of RelBE toxin-antitoxin system